MRKSPAKKRRLLPDAKFNDTMVTQFVNNMMYDGKKSTAFKIFYDALDIVESRVEEEAVLDVWKKAVKNVTPAVEVRSRRIGGATFQIPQPIRDARKLSMAMKWMIGYARKRNDKSMSNKLAAEIVAAYKEEGAAYKKKTRYSQNGRSQQSILSL